MKRQRILGFFDALVRTPAFLFLCAMFLCGALAGGLTGLRAGEGNGAEQLSTLLQTLPEHTMQSVICAVLWIALAPLCALTRPASLFLSGLAAARGFVLALTIAVGIGQEQSLLLSLCAAGIPAVLSVSALLAACAMAWQSGETTGRYSLRTCRVPFVVCILMAVGSALLRAGFAALWSL